MEGEVAVTPNRGEFVKFEAVELIVFPAVMDYKWDVHKAVRNYYRFSD